MYCVYLTVYKGNKMPPFYIGSSSIKKIQNGYHGSVSSKEYKDIWWQEIKDNSYLFESKIVCTFKTRQEATDKEYKLQKQLKILDKETNIMYINKAYAVANGYYGNPGTGKNHPNYGNKWSEEQKKNQSAKMIGRKQSEEHKKKKINS